MRDTGLKGVNYEGRPYCDSDAPQINALYNLVTERSRTLDAFEWQWLQAPAGRGEMWVIEECFDDGTRNLVGHHGLMPIPFSWGARELLFGKTENTFVHPAHRPRMLYSRFEKRFAADYEPRFDALFSTMGPISAIRQRRAQGYSFPAGWESRTLGTSPLSPLMIVARKRFGATAIRIPSFARMSARGMRALRSRTLNYDTLDDNTARKSNFFDGFWNEARLRYGVTPRRDQADLDWRFWQNPNCAFVTLVIDDGSGATGFVLLRVVEEEVSYGTVEDVAAAVPEKRSFRRLLGAAQDWSAQAGLQWLSITSIPCDRAVPGLAAALLELRLGSRFRFGSRRITSDERLMPRKITKRGIVLGLSENDWYVSGIVFEGSC